MKTLIALSLVLLAQTAAAAPISFLFGDKDCFGTNRASCADGDTLISSENVFGDGGDNVGGRRTDFYYPGSPNGNSVRPFSLSWNLDPGTVITDATVTLRTAGLDDARSGIRIDGIDEAFGITGRDSIGTIVISSLFSTDTVNGDGGEFALDPGTLASFVDGIDLDIFQFDTDGLSVDYIEVALNSLQAPVPAPSSFLLGLMAFAGLAARRRPQVV